MPPPLLHYDTVAEYKRHYEKHYQRGAIVTSDGIRVYFKPQKFGHAFYENSQRKNGPKDEFSLLRAQRMDWIRATLEHPQAELYVGWNKDERCFEEGRRVSLIYGDFVVVIELSLSTKDELKGNFVTCYVADHSLDRIRSSPKWDKERCLTSLRKKGDCR